MQNLGVIRQGMSASADGWNIIFFPQSAHHFQEVGDCKSDKYERCEVH